MWCTADTVARIRSHALVTLRMTRLHIQRTAFAREECLTLAIAVFIYLCIIDTLKTFVRAWAEAGLTFRITTAFIS